MKPAFLGLLLVLGLSHSSEAATPCTGLVTTVGVNSGGLVVFSAAGVQQYVYLCQIGANAYGVAAETCKAWYTHVLAAKLARKPVTFWFDDDVACPTRALRAWGPAPTLYFIDMVE